MVKVTSATLFYPACILRLVVSKPITMSSMPKFLVQFTFALLFLSTSTVTFSQIILTETSVELVASRAKPGRGAHIRDLTHIRLTGDITMAAVGKLAALLPNARRNAQAFTFSGEPVVRLLLDSRGGEIQAGIQLGRLVRAQALETWVDTKAECSSACILVLAGGVSRQALPGAKLGLHRPFFQPNQFGILSLSEAQRRYSALVLSVSAYLSEMGIATTLHEAMMKIPSQNVRYVSWEFADLVQLLGDDPSYQEWQRAKDRLALGEANQRAIDGYVKCVDSGGPDAQCSKLLTGFSNSR